MLRLKQRAHRGEPGRAAIQPGKTKREQFRLNFAKEESERDPVQEASDRYAEKDSHKPIKTAGRKQASRDRKRIRNNAKNDDWSDRLCDQRRGSDAARTLKSPGACGNRGS